MDAWLSLVLSYLFATATWIVYMIIKGVTEGKIKNEFDTKLSTINNGFAIQLSTINSDLQSIRDQDLAQLKKRLDTEGDEHRAELDARIEQLKVTLQMDLCDHQVNAQQMLQINDEQLRLDKNRFQQMMKDLPRRNSSIEHISNYEMSTIFIWDDYQQMLDFGRKCEEPAYRFFDCHVEECKQKLKTAISIFENTLTRTTCEHEAGRRIFVFKKVVFQKPGAVKTVIANLNRQAKEILQAYDEFELTAINRLRV